MGVKNRVVALTVGMVLLAGILSGTASFFSTRHAVDGYSNAVKFELERKARAYAQTGRTLLPERGDEALVFIEGVLDAAFAESALLAEQPSTTSPDEFENPLLGYSARVPDASASEEQDRAA